MCKRQMTFRQWRAQLGEALPIHEAAAVIGMDAAELARAAGLRKLPVYRFQSGDGRAYHFVRVADLLAYHRQRSMRAVITPEGMRRAFARMAGA